MQYQIMAVLHEVFVNKIVKAQELGWWINRLQRQGAVAITVTGVK